MVQSDRNTPFFSSLLGSLSRGLLLEGSILLLTAMLRLWALDMKPAHFDEGINGCFVDQMRAAGFYRYDDTRHDAGA